VDRRGRFWLFGGQGLGDASFEGRLNDLWRFDPQTGQWTWIKGPAGINQQAVPGAIGQPDAANNPASRRDAATWVDERGNLWLFGGYCTRPAGFGYLNDLWKFDVTALHWTWVLGSIDGFAGASPSYGSQGVPAASNHPGARNIVMAWTDEGGKFWLFGGDGISAAGFGSLNDLWHFDPLTELWTWIHGTDTHGHAGVFGTQNVADPFSTPSSRIAGVTWVDDMGNLWLFGGQHAGNGGVQEYQDDVWRFTLNSEIWTWIKGSSVFNQPAVYGSTGIPSAANTPGARERAVSWTGIDGTFWLFGGITEPHPSLKVKCDLWKFDAGPATGMVSSPGERSVTVKLQPNVPNPFSKNTTLHFSSQFPSTIRILVVNVLGQSVYELSGQFPAGSHSVPVDTRDWISGLYLVVLRSASIVQTQPMLRLR
jgi:N-acetylneuraminic acid mutarotase